MTGFHYLGIANEHHVPGSCPMGGMLTLMNPISGLRLKWTFATW